MAESVGARTLQLLPVPGVPMIAAGDDLAALIASGLDHAEIRPQAQDVLVVAQKIVSKAEGRLVDLATVTPSERALEVAAETGKDPRLVAVILSEAKSVLRARPGVLIIEHRLGFMVANAGVDQSNTGDGDGRELALMLPEDPDASAASLRAALQVRYDVDLAVIISDSFGRPWRVGTAGVAIGAAGLPALRDQRGTPDLFGRILQATEIGFADEIAAAASLLMGQAAEGTPVVLVRGLGWAESPNPAGTLIRPAHMNLFR